MTALTARRIPIALALAALAPTAAAQHFDATLTAGLDRWMYPFASTPGAESAAPSFGAIEIPGFDDRDAQFLIGFETAGAIPAGRPAAEYRVRSVQVRATVSNERTAHYDPTLDPVQSLFLTTDPQYVPDADTGRAVELYGVGFRNGWTASSFLENSPFGGAPIVPPSEGARNVFAAIFDPAGNATDVSRQVRQRFNTVPMAVGQTGAVAAGDLLPRGTVLTFDVDLCDPATRAYFARQLAAGTLRLAVSTLEPAQGGPDGGSGAYPAFYTKENILGDPTLAPSVRIDVIVADPADFNADGFVTGDDFDAYVVAFEAGDPAADFNADCFVTGDDFDAYVEAFR